MDKMVEAPVLLSLQAERTANTAFSHNPIEHSQSSIRLIEVSAKLSPEGLIQCNIVHRTIESESYVCLSYRWGAEIPSKDILLGGKLFSVRQNLFDFLALYRLKVRHACYIWIDALCIDQYNVPERNYQVAQMGDIFSGAVLVFVWLGEMPSLGSGLRSLANWRSPSYGDWGLVRSSGPLRTYIYDNEYWKRAWITQEIALAKSITIVLDDTMIDFSELLRRMASFYLLTGEEYHRSAFSQYSVNGIRFKDLQGQELITLLGRFGKKHCGVPQDRVFSLLSLCSPRSRMTVHYRTPIIDLAYTVLANRGSSLCICDALVVVHSLDLRRQYPEGTVAGQAFDRLHIELDMRNLQIKPEARFRASESIECNSFYRCAIYQVCRNFGRFFDRLAEETSWLANYFGDEPRHKGIPWIYRKMANGDHLRTLQVGHGKVEIITGDAGPESYTVRISIRFLISLVDDFMYSCVRISSRAEGDHDGFKVKQTPDDGPPVTLAGERFACVAGRIVRILNWSVADRNETRCSPVSTLCSLNSLVRAAVGSGKPG